MQILIYKDEIKGIFKHQARVGVTKIKRRERWKEGRQKFFWF
jgi:hypothetical protein